MLLTYIHGSLVSAGFLLMFAGMVTARFMKKKTWWFRLHKALGILGVCFVLAGVCVISIHLCLISAGHLNLTHGYIGSFVAILSVVTPIMGFVMVKIYNIASKIRPVHRWMGRLVLVSMAANIVSGLYLTGIL